MPVKKPSACCIPKGRNTAGALILIQLSFQLSMEILLLNTK